MSVMTEITDTTGLPGNIPEAVRRFVLEWGNLGERWGVNRSVSQIHALLYASKHPLAAEDIADTLGIARSNVSNSLRELRRGARRANSTRRPRRCANASRCRGMIRAWTPSYNYVYERCSILSN